MIKKIEAIIREEKLDEVKEALKAIGIVGMNVFEVQGHGRQGGITLAGRSGTYQIDMLPRVQLNIILSDHNVEKTVKTIRESARTGGDAGDGLIFIYPVEDAVRIRTGERGSEALAYQDDIDSRLAKYYSPPPRKEKNGDTTTTEEGKPGLFSRLKSRILK
ncbi:MAG TPA: P-II family nitrogen regulator [Candidatus Anoxymicrobiaceae bacterium]|jgi:nitrogen regulatory protein P-II 1